MSERVLAVLAYARAVGDHRLVELLLRHAGQPAAERTLQRLERALGSPSE